jgi:leucyl-tRNA synthetase
MFAPRCSDWSIRCNIPMHRTVVLRFIEALTVMMAPITPHWCELIWGLLGHTTSVCDARWPAFQPCDKNIRKEYIFFRDFLKNFRLGSIKLKVAAPKCAHVYLASTYEPLKIEVLQYMQTQCDAQGKFPATFVKDLKPWLESQPHLQAATKVLMQFAAFMRDEAEERGVDALATVLPINQKAILEENRVYLMAALELTEVAFHDVDGDADVPGDKKKSVQAVPGKPSFSVYQGTK